MKKQKPRKPLRHKALLVHLFCQHMTYIEDVVITVARLPREQEERFESGIFYHFWGTYSNFQKLFMGKRTTVFRILRR